MNDETPYNPDLSRSDSDQLPDNLGATISRLRGDARRHGGGRQRQLEAAALALEQVRRLSTQLDYLRARLDGDPASDSLAYAHAVQRGRARALHDVADRLTELLDTLDLDGVRPGTLESFREEIRQEAEDVGEHAHRLGCKIAGGGRP
ncbi:hypothetical protein BRD56_10510 [Thermoplasmatales archaeon SW_10_69_26]|nr:MAG: hypothetical protein BRD56_10510 [Thermoplasmatales archaeon SW_10_69_26]